MNIENLDFNPYECSLEELQNKIDYYQNLAASENDFQMAVKLFINSVYGCLGTRFYNLYNPDIAEAITLQGQDLIKYSAEKIDQYVSDYWHLHYDAHNKIAEYMKNQFDEFNIDKFLEKAKKPIIGSETNQVGGDSVVGSSMIKTTDGNFTIEELFNECTTDRTSPQKLYVKSNRCIYNVNDNNEIITSKIKYIIRHKVDKDIWTLCSCGNYVHATEDHSFIVIRNDEKINVKPWQICKYDNVIIFDNGKSKICKIDNIFKNNLCDDVFVYDIEVETNNEHEHNFFANNILVHNTDSVSGNSIIITEKHKDGIKIEDFYNENINNIDNEIDNKHEAVKTDDKVLNWDNNLYFGDIKRIIRHKVSKKKWQLKTKSGKIIECTDDHSLIVFRNGEKMKIKPHEILPDDKVLSIVGKVKFIFEEIESCIYVGEYDDEYVYDIEMDDDTHTFICNDVLVHNSAYITFNPLMLSCEIPEHMGSHFIYAVYIYSLKGYIENFLEDYAKAFNCPKNVEEFELEKVARTVIYVAKKNYVMDIAWKEGNVHIPPAKKIIYAGIDVVKGSTPPWCREKQKEFIAWLISRYNDGNKPSYAEIVAKVKEYRKLFELQNPDQIFKSISISDYEKFIYDDKNTLTYNAEIKTIPQHVDAAARYNHLLYTTAKKYLKKYNTIKSGDKVRLYYINEKECFGYLPNQYPIEFAPKPDYDVCFAKVMLAPINRIIECAGYKSIPQTLTYSVALW